MKTTTAAPSRSRVAAGLVLSSLLGLATLAAPAASQAADTPPNGGRIMTMTRGMKIFGDAEYALINALVAHDKAALDALVDPSFEQRLGAAPGEPLPREEWLDQAPQHVSAGDRISQMAVHDEATMAVVSFLLQRPGKGDAFVVDVWRKDGDKAVLMVRYLSAAAAPSAKASHRVTGKASGPVVDTKK